ncbi:RrF2 family transcriptional regulator [Candidatus Desulfovibrio trichonymphae]
MTYLSGFEGGHGMGVSLKCQYGLRALFELARRHGNGLVRISEIAEIQAIPERFLENILNQLRHGGFVESRRGKGGGFTLAKTPSGITVGDIIRFIDGSIYNIGCDGDAPLHKCRLKGNCIFLPVWREAKTAVEEVYNSKSLQYLVDADADVTLSDYSI